MKLNELETMIEQGELSYDDRLKWISLLVQKDPDFQDLINKLVGYLKEEIPELKNLSEYSVMMSHLKVIAFVFYEFIFLELRQIEKNMFLETANEEYLIRYGKEFGIERKILHNIKGHIFIGKRTLPKSEITIPIGTKLFLENYQITFYTTEAVTLNETMVANPQGYFTLKVEIISYDSISKEVLNQAVFSSDHEEIDICHSLVVEEEQVKIETFDQFRDRLMKYSQAIPIYSEFSMKSKLENISIVRYVHIMPHRIPGKISFYIEFIDHHKDVNQKISQLKLRYFEQISLAYDFHIVPVKLIPLDLGFIVNSRSRVDRRAYEKEIREEIKSFLGHYNPKVSSLNIITLLQFFYRDEKIENVEMIKPIASHRILKSDSSLRYYLRDLTIQWRTGFFR